MSLTKIRLPVRQALLLVILILADFGVAQGTNDADKNAIESIRSVTQKIKSCPATEEVDQIKKEWIKISWGPPRDVKFDVEKTASLMTPYKGTVTFSVPYAGSEHRKTKEEAQSDDHLTLVFVMHIRYSFRVAGDSSRELESMEVKDAFAERWTPYNPIHPERLCWIAVARKD